MDKQEFAKVVQAWAEGKEIQFRIVSSILADKEEWITDDSPNWEHGVIWRIKPKTVRWRVALMRSAYNDGSAFPMLYLFGEPDPSPTIFVEWLTDWQETEI